MSLRIAVEALASPPVRVALAVIGAFAALFAVLLAVRPDMVMDVVHEVATMMLSPKAAPQFWESGGHSRKAVSTRQLAVLAHTL